MNAIETTKAFITEAGFSFREIDDLALEANVTCGDLPASCVFCLDSDEMLQVMSMMPFFSSPSSELEALVLQASIAHFREGSNTTFESS